MPSQAAACDRNDQTRYEENFVNEDFPALRPNYERRAHARHNDLPNNHRLR